MTETISSALKSTLESLGQHSVTAGYRGSGRMSIALEQSFPLSQNVSIGPGPRCYQQYYSYQSSCGPASFTLLSLLPAQVSLLTCSEFKDSLLYPCLSSTSQLLLAFYYLWEYPHMGRKKTLLTCTSLRIFLTYPLRLWLRTF